MRKQPVAYMVERAMSEATLEWCKPSKGSYLTCDPLYRKHPSIVECDVCGLDRVDDGLNPTWCPYCKLTEVVL